MLKCFIVIDIIRFENHYENSAPGIKTLNCLGIKLYISYFGGIQVGECKKSDAANLTYPGTVR